MRTARKLLTTAAVAGALALGVGVAPAHATSLRGVYSTQQYCFDAGWYGYQNYGWSWPECV
jgi:uncharacterized membrane protein